MQHPDRRGWWFALIAAVGFSCKAVLVKLAYRHGADAQAVLALRMVYSLPAFVLMAAYVLRQKNLQKLNVRQWLGTCALGFFGYYLAAYLDFLGLNYISAALERLVLFTYPGWVVILSALFLGKKITAKTALALLVSYLGIALALAHDLHIAGALGVVLLGSALVLASSLSHALFLLGSGQLVGQIGTTRMTAYASIVACFFGISQYFLQHSPMSLVTQPAAVHGYTLLMALLCSVLPMWCTAEAVRRIGAGSVAMAGNFGPIFTLLLAWYLLDEALALIQLLGALLVISGVMIAARRS